MTADDKRFAAKILRDNKCDSTFMIEYKNAGADALEREAFREETLDTHDTGCYTFGPAHYECALRKIEELEWQRDTAIFLENDAKDRIIVLRRDYEKRIDELYKELESVRIRRAEELLQQYSMQPQCPDVDAFLAGDDE